MTDVKQGAAEWLRGIIGRYEDKAAYLNGGCHTMAKMFGVVCKEETCLSCMVKMMTVIADRFDAERELPADVEWPRFEDGEPVKVGDELEFEGKTMLVCDATFCADGWALWCDREDMSGRLCGKYGEPVKRPTPKVLDADGVPIRIGDVLYSSGNECRVVSITVKADEACVGVHTDEGVFLPSVNPKHLSRKNPEPLEPEQADSWEKLEEDAMGRACELAGSGHLKCSDCEWGKEGIGCQAMARLEILKRAKKLAGIEDGGSK